MDLTLGHVSARNPGDRIVWIKRKGVALDEVEPDDVVALDIDDVDALRRPEYHLESVMHTEVYRARPEVGSVIHGHPVYGTALGATDAQLKLLTHDAVLFVDGLGDYDEGPALVTTQEQGRRGRRRARHAAGGPAAQPRRRHRRRGRALGGADGDHPGAGRQVPDPHRVARRAAPDLPGLGGAPPAPEVQGRVPRRVLGAWVRKVRPRSAGQLTCGSR